MAIIAEVGGLHRTRAGHDDQTTMTREHDKDTELGKREGVYDKYYKSSRWLPVKARRSRLLLTLAVLGTMWLLFHILPGPGQIRDQSMKRWSNPSDDVERFPDESEPASPPAPAEPATSLSGAPPRSDNDPTNPYSKHYYNDVIKFYKLGPSLRQTSRFGGFRDFNRNVLFAASTLKSISALLPLACEMRQWDRNTVHFAIFGRDDMTIEELQELNGLDSSTCDIYWHDARPDYAPYSTELRAETGATFAFKTINDLMHPQVIITNELDEEDHFFKVAVHRTAASQGHPIIQIPEDSADRLSWIARLDVEPLREWHEVSVEILVHAPPNSVGSLRRLMASLNQADYTGLAFPRLTFEIPVDVDPMLKHFLEQVRWPPERSPQLEHKNLLTVRHRIPSRKISPEEASIRFVESFYPTISKDDHVLVVSPNAQLSPMYYQYLMYNVLQYKYSDRLSDGIEHLLGISLDLPTTILDGSTPLKVPDASFYDRPYDRHGHHAGSTSFLWEAPNSGAALYFGDKWSEIHSYITNRIDPQKNATPQKKSVSAALPSWLEYFLELTRLRGYAMLYPSIEGATSLVTVHHESTHRPEEFDHVSQVRSQSAAEPAHSKAPKAKRDLADPPGSASASADEDPFITPSQLPPPIPEQNEAPLLISDMPLVKMLPNDGDLVGLDKLPFLAHSGLSLSRESSYGVSDAFAQKFRGEQGGCENDKLFKTGRQRRYVPGSANDLFCTGDETEEDYLEAQVDTSSDSVESDEPNLRLSGDALGAREFPAPKEAITNAETPLGNDDLLNSAGAGAAHVPLGADALPAGNSPASNELPLAAAAAAAASPDLILDPPAKAPAAGGSLDIGDAPVGGSLPPAKDVAAASNPQASLGEALRGLGIDQAGSVPIAGAPDLPPPSPPLAAIPDQPIPIAGAPDLPINAPAAFPDLPIPDAAPVAPLQALQGDGSLADPAIMQQLADAGMPAPAPPVPYNLPKKPTVPHHEHSSNQQVRVRERDGNIVAVPTDVWI